MTLADRMMAIKADFAEQADEDALEKMARATRELEATDILEGVPAPGDRARDFTLPDTEGNEVHLAGLLAERPVVLTFFRGSW